MSLVLGTAQIGMNYGITNTTGKPDEKTAQQILQFCLHHDINTFDTARAYGASEAILGKILSKKDVIIITKLKKLTKEKKSIDNYVEESVNESKKFLRQSYIHTLLIHCWDDYEMYKNEIRSALLKQIEKGDVRYVGASVYTVEEAITALKDPLFQHLQIPFNIIDTQWFNEEFQDLIRKRSNITIHVRSIYLQGVLISDQDSWPRLKNVNPAFYVKRLNKLTDEFKLDNRKELCIAYTKSFPWINGVVIGVDNLQQLEENHKLFQVRALKRSELDKVRSLFVDTPSYLVNPSLWKNQDYSEEQNEEHCH